MAVLTVIGVGNRLRGDDAVGPMLIDICSKQVRGEDLELIDAGSDALGILEYLEDRQEVIVVDACRMGKPPGTVVCFKPEQAAFVIAKDTISLHGLGLAEALKMADDLEMLPKNLKIIGIEPDSIQFNGELSRSVQSALKIAVKKINETLNRIMEVVIV